MNITNDIYGFQLLNITSTNMPSVITETLSLYFTVNIWQPHFFYHKFNMIFFTVCDNCLTCYFTKKVILYSTVKDWFMNQTSHEGCVKRSQSCDAEKSQGQNDKTEELFNLKLKANLFHN